MILTREQALKASGRVFKTVNVPELGGELRLGSLTAAPAVAFGQMRAKLQAGEPVARTMMLLIIEGAIVDEQGAPLFDSETAPAFLDRISVQTFNLLMAELPWSAPAPGADPGNSPASPSAA